jgi:hypothetical protein
MRPLNYTEGLISFPMLKFPTSSNRNTLADQLIDHILHNNNSITQVISELVFSNPQAITNYQTNQDKQFHSELPDNEIEKRALADQLIIAYFSLVNEEDYFSYKTLAELMKQSHLDLYQIQQAIEYLHSYDRFRNSKYKLCTSVAFNNNDLSIQLNNQKVGAIRITKR